MLVKDKIALERNRRGISTSKLADMVGVNIGTINRYEKGVIKTIPVETLRKIASALGCTYDELIREDPKRNQKNYRNACTAQRPWSRSMC